MYNMENRNFLSPLGYQFHIKKCPATSFFIQSTEVPGVSGIAVYEPNPFVKIPMTYDHLEYEPLTVSFKVDEDLQNYLEIFNWITALGTPESYEQYKKLYDIPLYTGDGLYSDISLIILQSNKEANFEATFIDAFPISISKLPFNSTLTDVKYITATVSFKYSYFTLTKFNS